MSEGERQDAGFWEFWEFREFCDPRKLETPTVEAPPEVIVERLPPHTVVAAEGHATHPRSSIAVPAAAGERRRAEHVVV